MNFEELLSDLPNGLHDAVLHEVAISYASRTVVLYASAVTEEVPDHLRKLRITLTGVAFFTIDPPDPAYPFDQAKPLWIDAGPGQPSTATAPVSAPPGTTLNWIYVNEWNSFIRFASESCRYEWVAAE